MTVTFDESISMARALAKQEGMLVGISCGAAAHCAVEVAKKMRPDYNVVTILPDTGERYLSTHCSKKTSGIRCLVIITTLHVRHPDGCRDLNSQHQRDADIHQHDEHKFNHMSLPFESRLTT